MRDRMTMFGILVLTAALAGGCAKSPAAPAAPTNAGGEAATSSDGPTVVCHLSCSGTEATGSGATEEEARADVSQHIAQNCNPDDGQYFIFCDPPQ